MSPPFASGGFVPPAGWHGRWRRDEHVQHVHIAVPPAAPSTPPSEYQQSFSGRAMDFAAGSVFGARFWTWTGARLRGMVDDWDVGVNRARCIGGRLSFTAAPGYMMVMPETEYIVQEHDGGSPREDCACGFYAFWDPADVPAMPGAPVISGVVEGFGRTLLGDRGFRCEKARIVAAVAPEEEAREYLRLFGWGESRWPAVAAIIAATYQIPVYSNTEEMLDRHPLSTPPSTQ